MSALAQVERIRQDRTATIQAFVEREARGEEVSVEELDAALTANGVTTAAFRAMVSARQDRNMLRERLAAKGPAGDEMRLLTNQLEAVNAQLKYDIAQAEARFHAAAQPIQTELARCRETIGAAHDAHVQLIDTADDNLKRRKRAIEIQKNQFDNSTHTKCRELADSIGRLREAISRLPCGDEQQRLQHRLKDAERQQNIIREQGVVLVREAAEVFHRMLTS